MHTYWIALILGLVCPPIHAVSWFPFGPDGGSARAFAADPQDHAHLYLGTANGWVYETRDGGRSWKRLARMDNRDDLVIKKILVDSTDSKHLVTAAYALGEHADGGLFMSSDGGVTWASQPEMRGQSIRALAAAPSDARILVAGTLEGVFRSMDSGAHWERISPKDNAEIHEIESLAVDPTDPGTIYAGTWHLAWKTVDGGANWTSIKQGIIEDSDVFSILIDPKQPLVVYLSACSGIYKSVDGGAHFTGGVGVNRAQGIPTTARRTRVILQDPSHLDTVFAGTTEGLYRTDDAGKFWVQTTGSDVIVNDVYVDPTDPHRVLLATDRQGVLASDDGGASFLPSNSGFSARQITAYSGDTAHPATVYVGVVNDKESGGVFVSHTGGLSWTQMSGGLDGHDVFSLGQAPDGSILAGTEHGMYRLTGAAWQRVGGDTKMAVTAMAAAAAGKPKTLAGRQRQAAARQAAARGAVAMKSFAASVYGFAVTGETMYAATAQGLLRSVSSGLTWVQVGSIATDEWRFVAASKTVVAVASLNALEISADGGKTWHAVVLPTKGRQVSALAVDGEGELWVGDRDGVYESTNKGASWQTVKGLFVRNVNSIFYDEAANRMLVSSNGPGTVAFAVEIGSMQVSWWDTGWNLRFVRPVGDHLVAATLFDGIVVQPRMVDSEELAKH
jgi:photosystem II stability/assembly factor-like uncharacterized protein